MFGTRYQKGTDVGLPPNVTIPPLPSKDEDYVDILRPLYEAADGVLLWLGDHGTVNTPGIPKVGNPSKAAVVRRERRERNRADHSLHQRVA